MYYLKKHRDAINLWQLVVRVHCTNTTLIVLTIFVVAIGFSGCGDNGNPDYYHETYHPKNYPECTYALYRDRSGCDETRIIYYFHGSGGNELSWNDASREIIAKWKKQPFKSPLVVAVTFGKEWLMFPQAVSGKSIHLEDFVNYLMPEIEQQAGGKIKRRYLYGFSLGGLNASQLFFRYPELFDKAVITSPDIYPFSIYASEKEIDVLSNSVSVKNSGIISWIKIKIFKWNSVARNIHRELLHLVWNIPDPHSWDKADILTNMKSATEGERKSVYISCGRNDEEGFFPGSERLAAVAANHGYDVTFDILEGGHITLNNLKIATFLEK